MLGNNGSQGFPNSAGGGGGIQPYSWFINIRAFAMHHFLTLHNVFIL
jgi:hypothetical protein